MPAIRMDFAGVEQLSNSLTNEAQDNVQKLSALAAKANPEAVWAGDSASAYRNAFDRYQKAQRELQNALTGLSKAVSTVKNHFQEINQQGANSFNQFFG